MGERTESFERGATLDGPYRYRLWRRWSLARPALFVMLNPSTADAERDDPTIRRCVRFARGWGYGGVEVVNLFAYRATNPSLLHGLGDAAVGPENDRHVVEAVRASGIVVAAWGARSARVKVGRDAEMLWLLEAAWDGPVYCLGKTKSGAPQHPLYVRADAEPAVVSDAV